MEDDKSTTTPQPDYLGEDLSGIVIELVDPEINCSLCGGIAHFVEWLGDLAWYLCEACGAWHGINPAK